MKAAREGPLTELRAMLLASQIPETSTECRKPAHHGKDQNQDDDAH
jgi:hypothetical protein